MTSRPFHVASAAQLLNLNKLHDVELLDKVVSCMYRGSGDDQAKCAKVLEKIKQNPEAWTRAVAIIELSNKKLTQYYALEIIEEVVKKRWHVISKQKIAELKVYLITMVANKSIDYPTAGRNEKILDLLNNIVVEFLIHDYDSTWSYFTKLLIKSSELNESHTFNYMKILQLYFAHIFDPSRGPIEPGKLNVSQRKIQRQFMLVIGIIEFSLRFTTNIFLMKIVLEILLLLVTCCLPSCTTDVLYGTEMIKILTSKYLIAPYYRTVALQILTKYADHKVPGVGEETAKKQAIEIYSNSVNMMSSVLPIKEVDSTFHDPEEGMEFVETALVFLTTFHMLNPELCMTECFLGMKIGLMYIVEMTKINNRNVFLVCITFWNWLCDDLYRQSTVKDNSLNVLQHDTILAEVLEIMLVRMEKPMEVIAAENDNDYSFLDGITNKENVLYVSRKVANLLRNMTRIRPTSVFDAMLFALHKIEDADVLPISELNSLCWSIGSVSCAIPAVGEMPLETVFVSRVFQTMIYMATFHAEDQDPEERAALSFNAGYLIGQYLKIYESFPGYVKQILRVLFYFMVEQDTKVQTMACNTFVTLARARPKDFITMAEDEPFMLIESIFLQLPYIVRLLQESEDNVATFYEAIGHMIRAETDQILQELLIKKTMMVPNSKINEILGLGLVDPTVFTIQSNLDVMLLFVKVNRKICQTVENLYLVQFRPLFSHLIDIYGRMSEYVDKIAVTRDRSQPESQILTSVRNVKREILKLVSDFVSTTVDVKELVNGLMPSIMNMIVYDFKNSAIPEDDALGTMRAIVAKIKTKSTLEAREVISYVFDNSTHIIGNFADVEETIKRVLKYYLLITDINRHCPDAWFLVETIYLKNFLDSLGKTITHPNQEIVGMGMSMLFDFFTSIDTFSSVVMSMYRTFFMPIFEAVLSVITEGTNLKNLNKDVLVLAHLCSVVQIGSIVVPRILATRPSNNIARVQDYVVVQLHTALPRLDLESITMTVKGMMNLTGDFSAFKEYTRNFLVQIRRALCLEDAGIFIQDFPVLTVNEQRLKLRYAKSVTLPGYNRIR